MGIKPKKKPCTACGRVDYIFSKGRCKKCAQKAYAEKARARVKEKPKPLTRSADVLKKSRKLNTSKPLKRSPIKYRKKPTGERALFLKLWEEREHKCQVTGVTLSEPKVHYFSHLLPKSRWPEARLDPANIWIVHEDVHAEWQHGDRSLPMFAEKRAAYEALRIQYDNRDVKK